MDDWDKVHINSLPYWYPEVFIRRNDKIYVRTKQEKPPWWFFSGFKWEARVIGINPLRFQFKSDPDSDAFVQVDLDYVMEHGSQELQDIIVYNMKAFQKLN